MYYSSKNNNVFCRKSCSFVRKIMDKNLILYNTIEEAETDGKRKCKRCFKESYK